MTDDIKYEFSMPNKDTISIILIDKAAKLTSSEEVLDILSANMNDGDTLCDDFRDDLLWLVSVFNRPIEVRKREWKKRVDEYRKANGFGDDLITLEQAEKLRDYILDPVEIRGVPMSVYTVALDYDNRTVKVTMSATWL